jgi:hypothetical protein
LSEKGGAILVSIKASAARTSGIEENSGIGKYP